MVQRLGLIWVAVWLARVFWLTAYGSRPLWVLAILPAVGIRLWRVAFKPKAVPEWLVTGSFLCAFVPGTSPLVQGAAFMVSLVLFLVWGRAEWRRPRLHTDPEGPAG
jgi:hypothetical protein